MSRDSQRQSETVIELEAEEQKMARWEGFEPPTAWFVARNSIQLSYQRAGGVLSGPGGGSSTCFVPAFDQALNIGPEIDCWSNGATNTVSRSLSAFPFDLLALRRSLAWMTGR